MSVDNFKAGLQKVKEYVDGKVPALPATVAKTDVENTFTATQTFNSAESQAGVKTNAIDNESGDRIVYFDGTTQAFGDINLQTLVRTNEQRLKIERPVSDGTGTETVEVANVSDIGSGGVVVKRKTFSANVSNGTLNLKKTAFVSLSDSEGMPNWSTCNRGSLVPASACSPFSVGLDLQVGGTYVLKVDETSYSATCDFFESDYLSTGSSFIAFGTGGKAKKLDFTVGGNTLRIVDCAEPTDPLADSYNGGNIEESAEAMVFWTDFAKRAITGTLTLDFPIVGYIDISDSDITQESFVRIETPGTYVYKDTSGLVRFGFVPERDISSKRIVYDIVTGMGAGVACVQQELPKVKNVLIAPSGWTENKINEPTEGRIPSYYYAKPTLIFKDTAGILAAETAGVEVYQTEASPTKFGMKRTSENETIWAAVRFD